ncbi:MAG: hypothetical protein JXA01_09310 [Dehalococcoidia bacterium]|nr:hypothetical protein [Dehalococcoidia bacterium]
MKSHHVKEIRPERAKPASAAIACTAALLLALLVSCVTVESQSQEPYYLTEYTTENRTELYTETVPVIKTITHEENLQPYIIWSNPQLVFNNHKSLWYYGYDLSGFKNAAEQKIKILFFKQQFYEYLAVSVFDMHRRGQILAPPLISASDNISAIAVSQNWITSKKEIGTYNTWFGMANMKLDFARFLGGKPNIFLNSATTYPIELDTRNCTEVAILISGPTDPQNCRFSALLVWEESVIEEVTRTAERSIPVQVERSVLKQNTVIQSRQVPFWESLLNTNP